MTLSENPHLWTAEENEYAIAELAKKPLTELRKMQDVNRSQQRLCRDETPLLRLKHLENIYIAAIDRREFQ